ncbi:glycosyltransferase family 4 protein [Pseudomonas sp. RL_15y_Pfl2_60]|uniref:glycosyltransferase family 4 protein n=1 Tax=Pseudomonas sp. RL_15y_Pfl2_60 TaxID=3088709 RepID=UPI0030D80C39
MSASYKAVVLTTVHNRNDTRVFHKECPAIGGMEAVDLSVLVADGKGDEQRELYNIIDCGKAPFGRLGRVFLIQFAVALKLFNIRPKVVHIHDPELTPLAILMSIFGIKIIYDVHEDVPLDILDKYWLPKIVRPFISKCFSLFEKLSVLFFWKVIAATPSIYRKFNQDKTVLIENFPMLEEFEFYNQVANKNVSINNKFVYVGAITRIRGIVPLINSFASNNHKSSMTLCLAGEFSPLELLSEVKQLDGWSNVNYVGQVGRHELKNIFSDCVAGVVTFLPANNHLASQPNKLFEYMAAGVPIIASDFPAWRDIIATVNCGVLVDPESAEAIYAGMKYLVDNPAEAALMGQRGRAAVMSSYNWGTQSTKLTAIYAELL